MNIRGYAKQWKYSLLSLHFAKYRLLHRKRKILFLYGVNFGTKNQSTLTLISSLNLFIDPPFSLHTKEAFVFLHNNPPHFVSILVFYSLPHTPTPSTIETVCVNKKGLPNYFYTKFFIPLFCSSSQSDGEEYIS